MLDYTHASTMPVAGVGEKERQNEGEVRLLDMKKGDAYDFKLALPPAGHKTVFQLLAEDFGV